MKAPGTLIIISAPSGTGKTSLSAALRQRLPSLRKSVSHTTRAPRPGEHDGIDYNFVSRIQFDDILKADKFLEHAEVFGNHYGTSRDWVNETLNQGLDVILEIDWQGAVQISALIPDAVSIFILPPSMKVLTERLTARNQDAPDTIALRLEQAKLEVTHYNEYDYLIVNDSFEHAVEQLVTIITAAGLRCSHQEVVQHKLIDELCKSP